eukprot:5343802-Pyramimonas_sp.AAC.1
MRTRAHWAQGPRGRGPAGPGAPQDKTNEWQIAAANRRQLRGQGRPVEQRIIIGTPEIRHHAACP